MTPTSQAKVLVALLNRKATYEIVLTSSRQRDGVERLLLFYRALNRCAEVLHLLLKRRNLRARKFELKRENFLGILGADQLFGMGEGGAHIVFGKIHRFRAGVLAAGLQPGRRALDIAARR